MSAELTPESTGQRWPRWVYAQGSEPDYRFSFANERTFLAWIRTALALLAAGVALHAVPLELSHVVQTLLAGLLTVIGTASAVVGWVHWARSERAVRNRRPLPANTWMPAIALLLAATGAVVLLAFG